jgi:hypothetical protein
VIRRYGVAATLAVVALLVLLAWHSQEPQDD